jgi:hypothetical protein
MSDSLEITINDYGIVYTSDINYRAMTDLYNTKLFIGNTGKIRSIKGSPSDSVRPASCYIDQPFEDADEEGNVFRIGYRSYYKNNRLLDFLFSTELKV